MKRFFLTLSCIISVIWLLPCFVHASYTAPDGNEYEFKYPSTSGSYNPNYFYIYSNKKIVAVNEGQPNNSYLSLYGLSKDLNGNDILVSLSTRSNQTIVYTSRKYPSGNTSVVSDSGYYVWLQNGNNVSSNDTLTSYNYSQNYEVFYSFEDAYNYLTTPDVDFENLYYDPTIPTPNFVVTMERPTPWSEVSTDTNFFDVTWEEYSGYYVQIGYKFSYPNGMKVGLVDGQKTYTPLTYANSNYIDLWPLEDMHDALYINSLVNGNTFELESAMIQDSDSWQTSVPIWANNFNNSAYTAARNQWNTKMRYCWPLYGLKLEIFERLFYIADGSCYVGAWKHWNNTYPTDYNEEIPNNYQIGNSMPGYQNVNNNTDYQEQDYTQTSIGTQTGTNNTPTVVVNNLTQNYPDYPTVATYNHDNILLQMIETTNRLPSFFGEFTDFCKECLTVLPSEIWEVIAFGFLCSILVMIVKVL